MKFYNVKDFKTSQKIFCNDWGKKVLGVDFFYIVPMKKNQRYIKTDYNQKYHSDKKENIFLIENGNPAYNGMLRIHPDGTFSQYRDGSIYEYVGKVAL